MHVFASCRLDVTLKFEGKFYVSLVLSVKGCQHQAAIKTALLKSNSGQFGQKVDCVRANPHANYDSD